jgi:nucleotide-binding universal stress UspA family protein
MVTNASAARIAADRQQAAVAEAKVALNAIADAIRTQGLPVTARVEERYPSTAIVEAAAELQADLIVMATHGRAAPLRTILGSVAEEVLRTSRTPLLLIPPSCTNPWPAAGSLRVLVALDGSPTAEHILGSAVTMAHALDAVLLLLRVMEDERSSPGEAAESYLEEVARPLREQGASVRVQSVAGKPADRILERAQQEPAQVIAMATHGRSGLGRLLMGSVTAAVVRRAEVPLLVVGPTVTGLTPDGPPGERAE